MLSLREKLRRLAAEWQETNVSSYSPQEVRDRCAADLRDVVRRDREERKAVHRAQRETKGISGIQEGESHV